MGRLSEHRPVSLHAERLSLRRLTDEDLVAIEAEFLSAIHGAKTWRALGKGLIQTLVALASKRGAFRVMVLGLTFLFAGCGSVLEPCPSGPQPVQSIEDVESQMIDATVAVGCGRRLMGAGVVVEGQDGPLVLVAEHVAQRLRANVFIRRWPGPIDVRVEFVARGMFDGGSPDDIDIALLRPDDPLGGAVSVSRVRLVSPVGERVSLVRWTRTGRPALSGSMWSRGDPKGIWWYSDAAITKGDSGAPLFSPEGDFVGIVVGYLDHPHHVRIVPCWMIRNRFGSLLAD